MNIIPCLHFKVYPDTHCGIGAEKAHGDGLRAPRDCGTDRCGSHYSAAYSEYAAAEENGDAKYLTSWVNALKGKET